MSNKDKLKNFIELGGVNAIYAKRLKNGFKLSFQINALNLGYFLNIIIRFSEENELKCRINNFDIVIDDAIPCLEFFGFSEQEITDICEMHGGE